MARNFLVVHIFSSFWGGKVTTASCFLDKDVSLFVGWWYLASMWHIHEFKGNCIMAATLQASLSPKTCWATAMISSVAVPNPGAVQMWFFSLTITVQFWGGKQDAPNGSESWSAGRSFVALAPIAATMECWFDFAHWSMSVTKDVSWSMLATPRFPPGSTITLHSSAEAWACWNDISDDIDMESLSCVILLGFDDAIVVTVNFRRVWSDWKTSRDSDPSAMQTRAFLVMLASEALRFREFDMVTEWKWKWNLCTDYFSIGMVTTISARSVFVCLFSLCLPSFPSPSI